MSDNGDFLAGLVIGSLVGFVTGVLLAPAPGIETRGRIVDKTQSRMGQAGEGAGRAAEKVRAQITRAADTVKEKFPRKGETESEPEPDIEQEPI